MLIPRLTDCKECSSIQSLIEDIDCRMAQLAGKMYNNISFMLNQPISADVIIDLLTYKRILQYKYVNPGYASDFTVNMIASKIKLLKFK